MSELFGGGGQTSTQKALTTAQTNAATFGLNTAKSTIPQATTALQQPLNFFQALLSGNRDEIMSALSPEISSLSALYNTGRQTAEQFAPRGGGRAAALEELPFQEAGQIEGLVQGAQTEGATGITDIAQLLGQLGLGELNAGNTAASSADTELQTSLENQQAQQAQAGTAVGSLVALLVGA